VIIVVAGTALAWADLGRINIVTMLLTAVAASLIQGGTNLYNDAGDYERGADSPERLGPPRAAAQGWLSVRRIKTAAFMVFTLAFVVGIHLAFTGGLPIVIIGVLALACGYAYTGGPKPIGYTILGELFVIAFFGVAAVTGSYYLQADAITGAIFIAGIALGLPAAAILVVNNHRDRGTDAAAGKCTLAMRLGPRGTIVEFAALYSLAYAAVVWLGAARHDPSVIRWVALSLPWAIWLVVRLATAPVDQSLNRLLAQATVFHLCFSMLLTVGIVM